MQFVGINSGCFPIGMKHPFASQYKTLLDSGFALVYDGPNSQCRLVTSENTVEAGHQRKHSGGWPPAKTQWRLATSGCIIQAFHQ
jgi:hypothetical protein